MHIALGRRSLMWIHKQICDSPVMDRIGPPTEDEMEVLWAMMDIEDEIVVAMNENQSMNMAFSMLVARTKWDDSQLLNNAFGGIKSRYCLKVTESNPTQEAAECQPTTN